MNIACHSSFDNNFKISVATPPSSKVEKNGAAGPKTKTKTQQRAESMPSISSSRNSPALSSNDSSTPYMSKEFGDRSQHLSPNGLSSLPHCGLVTTYDSSSGIYAAAMAFEQFGQFFGDSYDPFSSQSAWDWDFDFSLEPYAGLQFPDLAGVSQALEPSRESTPATQFRFVNSTGSETFCGDSGLPIDSISKNRVGTKTTEQTGRKQKQPEEWTPWCKKKARLIEPTSSPSPLMNGDPARNSMSPTPSPNADFFYFMHYDGCIRTMYTLKEDARWNYHTFILKFIQQCSPDFPFRIAVLAWTSKHFSSDSRPDDLSWASYYSKASGELQRLMAERPSKGRVSTTIASTKPSVASRGEIVICTALFLCRCDVLANNYPALSSRLSQLRDWLSVQSADLELSCFASKVLLWLSYLHVRLSIFYPDTSDGSTVLDAVTRRSDHRRILARSQMYLAECFGDQYPQADLLQDKEIAPVSNLLHETFSLLSSIIRYRSWRQSLPASIEDHSLCHARKEAIDADIRRIAAEFGLAVHTNPSAGILRLDTNARESRQQPSPSVSDGMGVEPSMSVEDNDINRTRLHWLSCYAAFLVAQIMWSRILYPHIRTDPQSEAAVDEILQIALKLRKAKSGMVVRSMLWPLPLFVAGIETTDAVHADWLAGFISEATNAVTKKMAHASEMSTPKEIQRLGTPVANATWKKSGGGMSGGTGGERVVELMAEVRARQNKEGRRVEVEEVIRDMQVPDGSFIF